MQLKYGSKGDDVTEIQKMLKRLNYLSGSVDGVFGRLTESAVVAFQESEGLYSDGIIGAITFEALEKAIRELDGQLYAPGMSDLIKPTILPFVKVKADKYDGGYDRCSLRADVAEAYNKVREKVVAAGGVLTSSGGLRNLNDGVNANRSAVSFHYLGKALDLYIYSGMVNAQNDPYVAVYLGDRRFNIYARAEAGQEMELNAATYKRREGGEQVKGKFIDLTSIFKEYGFKPIRARSQFFNGGSELGAEWWHFQYEEGLIAGVSTFGNELLRVYPKERLEGTAPWSHKNAVFNGSSLFVKP
ncbi:MAG: peptidoglycan-binding protein [Candidatus Magnetoovum sp. WYHC-5]|nr:peptidoglycan-binding protein [Candidatus Magnetoovum sp. WYHC-5]